MDELPGLIKDLALISIYAAIVLLIFKKIKQPVVLGYILAGMLVGPHIPFLPTINDMENIHVWANIGVIFLLFGLGLEFSFKKIVNVGKSALITATANILFLLFVGYQVGLILGWNTTDSLFLGGMISMSSTTIIIKAFDELNLKKEPFTFIVFGILVVEDVVGVLLLVLLPTIAIGKNVDGIDLLYSALKLAFFLVLWFISGIYLIPTLLKKIQKLLNDELILVISIALCLGMVLLAAKFGFSSALGAFIMGSILAETPIVEKIEKIISPVKDFFGAVFFVSVGLIVNPEMFVEYAKPIVVITIIVVVGQISMTTFGLLLSGKPLETALKCGFSLAQVGEFAFIIATLGVSLDVVSPQLYPIIVAVSVITTFTTPMMIKASRPIYEYVNKHLPDKYKQFLSKHTSNRPTPNVEENLWRELFQTYFITLLLTSVILIALININFFFVFEYMRKVLPDNISSWLTALICLTCMAPFLRNLMTPGEKVRKLYVTLWRRNFKNRFPLIFLSTICMVIAAMYVMVVLNHLVTKNIYVTYVIVFGLLYCVYKTRFFLTRYHMMEGQFLKNLYNYGEDEVVQSAPLPPAEKNEQQETSPAVEKNETPSNKEN